MSSALGAGAESGRARPASGGLWALLAARWWRGSSDSLSSAGSDRSAASFAFLAAPAPAPDLDRLPPAAPPTDSYRKRVHDGDRRRLRERNLTLHRKYGLYYGYDAFSLPPARKSNIESDNEREKRANSESLPRRAHVPGKRRAPPPPARRRTPSPSPSPARSLARRSSRKRPAPQPPSSHRFTERTEENIRVSPKNPPDNVTEMNPISRRDRCQSSEMAPDECKSEKHSKKEIKDRKVRTEKSFLKQIFENRKRYSAVEVVPERILPSISELDKQAAEIINLCKLTPLERNHNSLEAGTSRKQAWFCTRCLRKYDSTVVTCQHCLPEQKRLSALLTNHSVDDKNTVYKDNSATQTEKNNNNETTLPSRVSGIETEQKQKLKEMLKEMKHSLPKKGASDKVSNKVFKFDSTGRNSVSLETPTLRIETKGHKVKTIPQPSTSQEINKPIKINATEIANVGSVLPNISSGLVTENVVITEHVVLFAPQIKVESKVNSNSKINGYLAATSANSSTGIKNNENNQSLNTGPGKKNLNEPLKISSLLNPVYIPKSNLPEEVSPRSMFFTQNHEVSKLKESNSISHTTPTGPCSKLATAATKQENAAIVLPSIQKPTTSTVEVKELHTEKHENKDPSSNSKELLPNRKSAAESTKMTPSPVSIATTVTAPNSSTPTQSPSTSAISQYQKTNQVQTNMVKFTVDQHSRRRELIQQLEQSIANGDEKAAADAAAKLAQLRLSCSVLSYSSQIIAGVTSQGDQGLSEKRNLIVNKPQESATNVTSTNATQSTSAVKTVNHKTEEKSQKTISVQPLKINGEVQTHSPSVHHNQLEPTQSQNQNKVDNKTKQKITHEPSTSKQILNEENDRNLATIQVWVEDREATRGPVRLRIPRQATMGDLRRQAETSFGLVSALQRWIVGRALCADDNTTLISLAGPDLSAPFYLCVVQTEGVGPLSSKLGDLKNANNKLTNKQNSDQTGDVYSELVQLERRALIVNAEPFECSICMERCAAGSGAVLRECVHAFCNECLSDLIKHCEEPAVTCPSMGCPGIIQEREIRALVTAQEYERWLARGLAAAESGTRNAFHCRTRDCSGWALCDPGVRRFPCPVCKHTNCIPCQAIHERETCEQYRKKLHDATATQTSGQTDEGTRAFLDTLIAKGEALECPECSAIITKKWGCDWVKCSACKTEICWVTRGRRWGPAGKGDTSAGCRCGVDGKRCHPTCGYCH